MKNSKQKQWLSFLLALIMLVTLLPVTAWAGDYDNFGVYAVSIWEKGSTAVYVCSFCCWQRYSAERVTSPLTSSLLPR